MISRTLAKILVVTTVAIMAFGLLSMAAAMEMGMHHCPIMQAMDACMTHAAGAPLIDHHIGGFQSMTVAIASLFFFLAILPGLFVRTARARAAGPVPWPASWLADGPPSPLASLLFWSALHNKTGYPALAKMHAFLA